MGENRHSFLLCFFAYTIASRLGIWDRDGINLLVTTIFIDASDRRDIPNTSFSRSNSQAKASLKSCSRCALCGQQRELSSCRLAHSRGTIPKGLRKEEA